MQPTRCQPKDTNIDKYEQNLLLVKDYLQDIGAPISPSKLKIHLILMWRSYKGGCHKLQRYEMRFSPSHSVAGMENDDKEYRRRS